MSSRVGHELLPCFLFYPFLPLHVFTFFLLYVRDDTRGRFPFSVFPAVHFRGFTYTSVHLSSYLPLPPSLSLYVILKSQAHPGFFFLFDSNFFCPLLFFLSALTKWTKMSPFHHLSLSDDTPETCIYSAWSPWSACSSATCDKGRRMRQRMLKAQLDLSVPCPHTQDFQPCMAPGCSMEGERTITLAEGRFAVNN